MAGQQPPSAETVASPKKLYVDLAGALIQTNLLTESLVGLVKTDTKSLLALPGWLLQGRPILKQRLAGRANPDPSTLPYRPEVLAYQRAYGATTTDL